MPFSIFNYADMMGIQPMGLVAKSPTSCPAGQKLVPYQAKNAQGQVIESGSTCMVDPLYIPPVTGSKCPVVPTTLTGGGYTYRR